MNIEYLRINIEDTSSVPIRLSFPVAFDFIESALNETCKESSYAKRKDKTFRSNGLVDDYCVTMEKLSSLKCGGTTQLTSCRGSLDPIEVNFKESIAEKKPHRGI